MGTENVVKRILAVLVILAVAASFIYLSIFDPKWVVLGSLAIIFALAIWLGSGWIVDVLTNGRR